MSLIFSKFRVTHEEDDTTRQYLFALADAQREGTVLDPIGSFLLDTPVYLQSHPIPHWKGMHVTQRELLVLLHRLITNRWAR